MPPCAPNRSRPAALRRLLTGLCVAALLAAPARAEQAAASERRPCPERASLEAGLARLNVFRTQSQLCGHRRLPAAPPLQWDARLQASASAYAGELSAADKLSHIGPGGSSLRQRFRASGYVMRRAGENLAAGQEDLDEVLATWTRSATHCENLMQPDFLDAGLACVSGPGMYERYWVLHLGRAVAEQP